MEVLNKLNRFRSTLSTTVESTVFSTVSTITNALPGNLVTRDFEVFEHIGSGGPGLVWKIYSGVKKTTRQPAAIFVLERKSFEQRLQNTTKSERDYLWDLYKKSISQLTRLRHPQILTVQHPLEESRDCLAFATEPVYASLANVMGRHENMPKPVPPHIRDYKMFDVEIKYGLLQVCEGLSFLHDSVKMIHRNISLGSIILNESGAWKIFGFDFCLINTAAMGQPPTWSFPLPDQTASEFGQPDLDFYAPEYALDPDGVKLSPAADMFSLGMLALTLYNTKPLFDNNGSWVVFKKNSLELRSLRESNLQLIPQDLREYLKMLLSTATEIRPTATQLTKISYFDDVGVKTLNNLDSQFQWDNVQKSQFYKGLPQIIPKLPHRVSLHRVVPCLAKEFVNAQMVPFVLPVVLQIAEEATNGDFVQYILPELRPVMKMTDPIQILLIFMQRMEMLLSKTPPTDVKNDVLPMIYRALESETTQIQELCLSIVPGFAGLLDYQAMKNALLPRIKRLCINTNLLSVRVNALICIGKLLSHLDKWIVMDDILPMLQQIPSREPAVIMAIIGIHKMAFSDAKLGMTKEVMATKVLPFLFPLSIENGLTVHQYSSIMTLIRELIEKVEEEHRAKLEQLNTIHNEQRSALEISMSENLQIKSGQLVATEGQQSQTDQLFSGLGLSSYVTKKDSGSLATKMMDTNNSPMPIPPPNRKSPAPTSNFTLEQKQKWIKESENLKRLNNEGSIVPSTNVDKNNKQNQAKDLTDTLLAANLNKMTTSQTYSSGFGMNSGGGFGANPSGGTQAFGAPLNSGQQLFQSPSMSSGLGQGSNSFGGWTMAPSTVQHHQQLQSKPDLSGFDFNLPMSKPKQSLNEIKPTSQPSPNYFPGGGSAILAPAASTNGGLFPNTFGTQSNNVKSLSPSEINDLLS